MTALWTYRAVPTRVGLELAERAQTATMQNLTSCTESVQKPRSCTFLGALAGVGGNLVCCADWCFCYLGSLAQPEIHKLCSLPFFGGGAKTINYKQLLGVMPETGGGQNCLWEALFLLEKRKHINHNSQKISGKCWDNPRVVPGQSHGKVVCVFSYVCIGFPALNFSTACLGVLQRERSLFFLRLGGSAKRKILVFLRLSLKKPPQIGQNGYKTGKTTPKGQMVPFLKTLTPLVDFS